MRLIRRKLATLIKCVGSLTIDSSKDALVDVLYMKPFLFDLALLLVFMVSLLATLER